VVRQPAKWSVLPSRLDQLTGLHYLLIAVGVGVTALVAWSLNLHAPVDFTAYYDAALRLNSTGTPYQSTVLEGQWRSGIQGLYVYTPVLALLMVPLTWLGATTAAAIWFVFRIGLLAATCALMPVPRRFRIASFAVAIVSSPFIDDLTYGNVSVIVAFFAVSCWRWLDKPLGALAIAGAVFVRPWMGIIGIWWLVRRQWRAVLWLAGGILVIAVLTLPFVGPTPWLDWVTVLRNLGDEMGVHSNLDLGSSALRIGLPASAARLLLYAGYAFALLAIAASLRRDRQISYAVTVAATLLLSPLFWGHYMTVLIVPAALVAARGRPLAILVPLLAWLPRDVTPFVVAAVMWMPFLVPDEGPPAYAPQTADDDLAAAAVTATDLPVSTASLKA
jgi:hypothetical protein